MATHSYTYIPTGRKPFEYMMSESWADGYLSWVGMSWFKSTSRIDQAIEATRILGGSPCFVTPEGEFEIKEEDFYAEGVITDLDSTEFNLEMVDQQVCETVEHILAGDLEAAKGTWLGTLSLEQQLEMKIALNLEILDNVQSKEQLKMFGESVIETMDLQAAFNAAKAGTLNCSVTYYFDVQTRIWWLTACVNDDASMQWLPVSVALYLDKDTHADFLVYFQGYQQYHPNDVAFIEQLKTYA